MLKSLHNNSTLPKTYYLRDAQACPVRNNILATYELTAATLKLKELNCYGSTRLGMFKPDFTVYPVPGSGIGTNYLNKKQYELTNHLGNVLAVITDNRSAMDTDNNGTPNYYEAVVAEAREYYPFGMVMPNRKTAGNSAYRYGFNGKENDDEPLGDDNEQDYGMRIYDPRVGRFLSVDPIAREYPWYTPYHFAGNKPIWAVDLDGLEEYYAADGSYIGTAPGSTEIRIIADEQVSKKAKSDLRHKGWKFEWLLDRSERVYTSNKERDLLVNWAQTYQPKIEDREFAMSLFTKTLSKNGKKIDVIMPGTTVTGPVKDRKHGGAEIDPIKSKAKVDNIDIGEKYGWKRSTTIHTHTGPGDSKFSNEMGTLEGYSGDIPWSLEYNVKILLVTKGSMWIKMFDPQRYREINPKGFRAFSSEHFDAAEKATEQNFWWIDSSINLDK